MGIFEQGIEILQQMGVYDIILPFMLIFAVIYAILENVKIFDIQDKPKLGKKINLIISLVLGLSVVFPHVAQSWGYNIEPDVIPIINSALPQVSIVVIAIVMVLLMLGIWGIQTKPESSKTISAYIAIAAFLIVGYIFFTSSMGYNLPSWLNFSNETIAIVIILLIFGLIVTFIIGEEPKTDEEKKNAKEESFMHQLNLFLGGK